ncbi:hypothetical protein K3X13_01010 [Aliiroseovarius crassostreae]|uniref:DUF6473 family protein n=1 Tax=Aliiroseovarius crassostreae TaxID=154981 RepID=UPI002204DFD2|nr:DUF6473 family protein [Aliiroseovarius crassostreae]UWP89342.1 hypothetical protein K3J57_01115 [Aliiroseovarius crassostreae]UWP92478.1 hypothetical protein K3X13_01010 [Aliiroseovarius crassostreae]UWQ01987.1 hypothetical protein K3X44_01115 [Aliiroseovarius crassostreae]
MAYQSLGEASLEYFPCRYGASKILFRGPQRSLDGAYVAALGGSETYGKFVQYPYPDLMEGLLGMPVVNFGCMNAGVDVFAHDQTILDACNHAKRTVLQVPGAVNLSNRFYAVHPRRNDRFLRASNLLKAIYREVDFTEFNFTRHMLQTLQEISAEKFAMVEMELKEAWVGRMKSLVARIESPLILLWLSERAISETCPHGVLGPDPAMVDEDMINEVRPFVQDIVEVKVSSQDITIGREDLVFPEMDAAAAQCMLGAVAHDLAADALVSCIRAHP